jgi:hypothetical protein
VVVGAWGKAVSLERPDVVFDAPRHIAVEGGHLAEKIDDLLTAGAIAKAVGASDAEVTKAIKDLGIEPKAKKGVCNMCSKDVVAKVKKALG